MILSDLNILLHAYNPHVPQHAKAAAWWDSSMGGDELIGLPLEVSLGFVRIATNPRLGKARVPLASANATVEFSLSLPITRVLLPKETISSGPWKCWGKPWGVARSFPMLPWRSRPCKIGPRSIPTIPTSPGSKDSSGIIHSLDGLPNFKPAGAGVLTPDTRKTKFAKGREFVLSGILCRRASGTRLRKNRAFLPVG